MRQQRLLCLLHAAGAYAVSIQQRAASCTCPAGCSTIDGLHAADWTCYATRIALPLSRKARSSNARPSRLANIATLTASSAWSPHVLYRGTTASSLVPAAARE